MPNDILSYEEMERLEPSFKLIPKEEREMRVMNRLNDALFKYLFAREDNKALLISFINSVLDDDRQIVDVTYLDRESAPKYDGGKGCRFDVRAKSADGRIFHIEVQANMRANFFERSLFYSCDTYSNQLAAGDEYEHLMPVIFIGVLGYEFFDCEEVYSHYMLMETERHNIGTEAMEFYFFELPKLKSSPKWEEKKFYRWLKYLSSKKSRGDDEMTALAEKDTMIAEALKIEELFQTDSELRFRYLQAQLEKRLHASNVKYLKSLGREEGLQEGVSIGEKLGIAKGRKEGREEGREEGAVAAVRQMALRLLAMGMDIPKICAATGLSEDEISHMASENSGS